MGGSVFVDTAALIALSNTRDSLHERARRINAELAGGGVGLVTTDWVLAEYLGGTAAVRHRATGIATVSRLRRSARTTIVAADRAAWERAFEFYAGRADKDWSFVDCTSMLVCEELSVARVFTSDHHFQQAGLEILLDQD